MFAKGVRTGFTRLDGKKNIGSKEDFLHNVLRAKISSRRICALSSRQKVKTSSMQLKISFCTRSGSRVRLKSYLFLDKC